jgi:hypothetical protein
MCRKLMEFNISGLNVPWCLGVECDGVECVEKSWGGKVHELNVSDGKGQE